MADPFHRRIHSALQDPVLQSALDGNAERRQKAWGPAFASLPESRAELRRRAHALRADVIANLDVYLQRFIDKAQENGVIVHRAANAAEAVDVILGLARSHQATRIAKSKTMVSEEVHLNHALEQQGIGVVETDLGEYIVQLREEPPAHIITPAVHLTRAQVGQTFVEKLGVAYTEDIPTLTAIARRILRQTFLDAQMGISGVNFGVAATGTLAMVTNEGNGRMCTTLPPVHVAMMGIERLVPTLDDLALMLYLLPRSATGQKLSVYTSLLHGPRRPGEVDGPQERHLVLLDNGRSALRGSPLNDVLFCIRCGACLNACPVFREIGGHAYRGVSGQSTPYPGPIGSVLSPGLFGLGEFGNLARATSLCGACKDACPVDIDLPRLLLRVRHAGSDMGFIAASGADTPAVWPGARRPSDASVNRGGSIAAHNPQPPALRSHTPWGLRLGLRAFTWMARSPRRYALAQRLGAVLGKLAPWMRGWVRLPAVTGWGVSRDFPLPQRPFRDRFASLTGVPPQATAAADTPTVSPAAPPPAPVDMVERFIVELTALGGQAFRCTASELPLRLLDMLQQRDIDAIQAWDARYFPEGLHAALERGGVRILREPDPALRAGLTGALAAIAESGTLALTGAPDRPLSASLLPETHIAVLRAVDILPSLPDALRLPELAHTAAGVLISGPSRTADIEMTLTIGVHGPRELLVFLI